MNCVKSLVISFNTAHAVPPLEKQLLSITGSCNANVRRAVQLASCQSEVAKANEKPGLTRLASLLISDQRDLPGRMVGKLVASSPACSRMMRIVIGSPIMPTCELI